MKVVKQDSTAALSTAGEEGRIQNSFSAAAMHVSCVFCLSGPVCKLCNAPPRRAASSGGVTKVGPRSLLPHDAAGPSTPQIGETLAVRIAARTSTSGGFLILPLAA
eukprot:1767568-Rhodomonas_salina.3